MNLRASTLKRLASSLAIAGVATLFAPSAHAGPPVCGTTNGNPVVYVAGTAKPYVVALAPALFADPVAPLTIVFKGVTSCLGVSAILGPTPINGSAAYYDPASPNPLHEEPCTLPVPDGGTLFADIGSSDVFADTCSPLPGGLPKNVGDFFGPVASMTFVVPNSSTQKSISATAAYYVYGLGAAGHVAPWIDENWILKRNETSGTGLLIAKGIGVDSTKWKGFDPLFSGAMIAKL
ncbi:MAG: hypothetical protein ABIP89_12065, partial [Polyangiaceae bacterium]